MNKNKLLHALKYTLIGLALSFIGQAFIGHSKLIPVLLTTIGVGFAAFGVFIAFGMDRFFK